MRKELLTWFDMSYTMRGKYSRQQIKNEYFYEMMEEINRVLVGNNETFEWKQKQIKYLVSLVGYPVKLTRWQKFLANYLMM
jgi:hypothetical protein